LFFRNAAQLVTLSGPSVPRRGAALGELGIISKGGLLTEGETILRVGSTSSLEREALRLGAEAIDCRGQVVMPGFVDSHTHLIFAGSRVNDYELRLRGKTYEEIAQAGGGIQSSAQKVRKASVSSLVQQAARFLDQFAAHGTTTVEVKSGYGLDVAPELKILRAIRLLQADQALELVPTLLALHALPASFRGRSAQYVDQVIKRLIPLAAGVDVAPCSRGCEKTHGHCHSEEPAGDEESRVALKTLRARSFAAAQDDSIGTSFRSLFSPAHAALPTKSGQVPDGATTAKNQVVREKLAEFIDCFCDRGAFSVEDCRRVFDAGRKFGLVPRIHPEQLSRTGAARLAIEFDAASADHLDKLSAADIRALARSDVVATLLPGANFHLGLKQYPPARKLIDAGAAVALATDFNPGTSPTLNMQFILSLACAQMQMTPAEAIAASTINAAHALRRAHRIGSLEAGKQADLIVLDVDDYREIPYYFAMNHCAMTVKRGRVIYLRS
jgi:imidazolonepropionase-like amidohydrolase